jgi:hypothetical protein
MQAYLARTGLAVFAMLLVIAPLTERTAEGSATVAVGATIDSPALEVARTTLAIDGATVVVAGVERAPDPPATAAPAVVPPAPVVVPPAPVVVVPLIVPLPVQNDAIVLASWYGPGFYGNLTACGQTYTPEIVGVAHLTLPCGTLVTLTYGSRSVTVAVIDRGPYIVGRTLDLSNATKLALGCTDLCTLRMQLAR